MFENKFDHETETREATYYPQNDENYAFEGAISELPKKKKKKSIAKAIGFICLALAISAGSIAGYKYIDEKGLPVIEKEDSSSVSETNRGDVTTNNFSSSEKRENSVDLLKISTKSGALTTQQIYDKVIPSVVGISATYEGQSTYNPWFGESQGNNATATGTGIIMSDSGYVLTNAHVIYSSEGYGQASSVSVLLYDENEYEAKIVAYDTATDIAVLDITNDVDGLVAAEFGDSNDLQVGDNVVAIGNPLGFDLFGTLTVGYVSGLNREVSVNDISMGLIQTDAAINSGNSGGPLINCYGQVIGINSLKMANSYSTSGATIEGLGFAIPITSAKEIIDDLIEYGYVSGRPQIGVSCKSVTSYNGMISGAQIMAFSEGSSAESAGLRINDVIVGINKEMVTDVETLQSAINSYGAGDSVILTVIRDGKYSEFTVTLTEKVAQKKEETTTAAPDPGMQS